MPLACFRFVPAADAGEVVLLLAVGSWLFPAWCDSCVRGFIWMILRDRVGGGGSEYSSLAVHGCAVLWRLLLLDGAYLLPATGDEGEIGRYNESDDAEDALDAPLLPLLSLPIAAGGRVNAPSSCAS